MALDLEKLKSIPIFKNVDFNDSRTRKRLALLFSAAALMILVIIANFAISDKNPDPGDQYSSSPLLEIPDGEDKDILEEEDMILARQRLNPGNKDLFLEANAMNSTLENPLAFLDDDPFGTPIQGREQGEQKGSSSMTAAEMRSSHKSKALAAFGIDDSSSEESSPKMPPSGTAVDIVDAIAGSKDNIHEAIDEGMASRTTPATINRRSSSSSDEESAGSARGAAKKQQQASSQPRGGRTLADAERQRRDGDAYGVQDDPSRQQYGQEEQPRAVRRSGGISSLDGDWGTIEGISSLDNESVYVTQDDDHPYKVMFTRDQKLKSGDRITIRLLEDMAVDGVLIPKNTHLSATCQIGERLQITVSNIEMNGRIYSLNYSAYDNDGSLGLYCPISGATKVSDQGKNVATQTASGLISSAASIAGAAMGHASLGSMLGSMTNIGASAVTSRNGSVTATVNSGYTFYLLKN